MSILSSVFKATFSKIVVSFGVSDSILIIDRTRQLFAFDAVKKGCEIDPRARRIFLKDFSFLGSFTYKDGVPHSEIKIYKLR